MNSILRHAIAWRGANAYCDRCLSCPKIVSHSYLPKSHDTCDEATRVLSQRLKFDQTKPQKRSPRDEATEFPALSPASGNGPSVVRIMLALVNSYRVFFTAIVTVRNGPPTRLQEYARSTSLAARKVQSPPIPGTSPRYFHQRTKRAQSTRKQACQGIKGKHRKQTCGPRVYGPSSCITRANSL